MGDPIYQVATVSADATSDATSDEQRGLFIKPKSSWKKQVNGGWEQCLTSAEIKIGKGTWEQISQIEAVF